MDSAIRVLYVESVPERWESMQDALEGRSGSFEVRTESNAKAALSQLEPDPGSVDCIVSAHQLPETDGIAFRRELDRRFQAAVPPFVLFVEDDSEAIAAEALNAGVSGYVRRDRSDPYRFLAERIRHAVDRDRSVDVRWERDRLEEVRRVVSHDLRSPLNVAKGYLEHASREHDDEEAESLDRVSSALDRLASYFDDLNALVRQGRPVDDPEVVDLAAVARAGWTDVDARDATLRVDVDGTVRGDDGRLVGLFRELYRNAVDHAGAETEIEVGAIPSGFYVEDDGPGIPEERREDVLEAGVSDLRNRTGFGLATVRHVAAAHGWNVSVCEGSAGGTRVEFSGVEYANADRPGSDHPGGGRAGGERQGKS